MSVRKKYNPTYSTPNAAQPKNPDRYGKLWNTIGFNLEGARRNQASKQAGVPIIGTLEIGNKSFDITWTEANRLIDTLNDAKHQYNVAERLGMLEPGTGTPVPVSRKTY